MCAILDQSNFGRSPNIQRKQIDVDENSLFLLVSDTQNTYHIEVALHFAHFKPLFSFGKCIDILVYEHQLYSQT